MYGGNSSRYTTVNSVRTVCSSVRIRRPGLGVRTVYGRFSQTVRRDHRVRQVLTHGLTQYTVYGGCSTVYGGTNSVRRVMLYGVCTAGVQDCTAALLSQGSVRQGVRQVLRTLGTTYLTTRTEV